MIKGNVDLISSDKISGWATYLSKPEKKCTISVRLKGKQISHGVADLFRPDLKNNTTNEGKCAFSLKLDKALPVKALEEVEVFAVLDVDEESPNEYKLPLGKNAIRTNYRPGGYQSFDGDHGDSNSTEKLKKLRLPSLQGKKVLDIGCNEGFFCNYAIKKGASRVLGVDLNPELIKLAKKRTPEAEFINASWWNLPDEKFDIILFMSAIHYERNQKELLAFLKQHLTVDGILVLECGVYQNNSEKHWVSVQRHDGSLRFPNQNYLIDTLLDGYAVTLMGRSVDQPGDPVPRSVFHCSPIKPTFLFIYGPSKAGKTNLARRISNNNLPSYSMDYLFHRLIGGVNTPKSKVSEFIKANGNIFKLDELSLLLIDKGLCPELVKLIMEELPFDANLSIIEGEMLSHQVFRNLLVQKIEETGGIVWSVSREQLGQF